MAAGLRWLVFGAGAIGTYIGGRLALAGQEVVFLERPEGIPGLRQRGLRLVVNDQEHRIPQLLIYTSLAEALNHSTFDVAVFALKAYDTASFLKALPENIDNLPPILCLQNGVENEAALATTLGDDKVIAGTVTSAVLRNGLGDITLERERGVGLAADHPLSPYVAQALGHAGFIVKQYRNAAGMKWSKLLTNLITNASSAILGFTPAEILANPRLFRLEIAQLREALTVMQAQEIPVVNLPGVPVVALALAAKILPLGVARLVLTKSLGSGRGGKMPSLYIDLLSGVGKSEVSYLNGAVVRFGEEFKIPTPVNQVLASTLQALAEGRISPEQYQHQPEVLLAQLSSINYP